MKKTWVRKTLSVGVLAAGALLLAPAASALADTDQVTTGNFGTLNGTQVAIPVTVPVNVVGNSAGVLGAAQSFGVGANQVESGRNGGGTRQASFQNRGFLNGTQVAVPVTVPVNVSGNAAAVAGKASATGVSANRVESAKATEHGWSGLGGFGGGNTDQVSFGNYGTLNGTQVAMPVTIPVNACGNSLALLGSASSTGICANQVGGGFARKAAHPLESKSAKAAKRTESGPCIAYVPSGPCGPQGSWVWPAAAANQASFGNYGTFNGTQFAAPITVPVNACGNSLGVLGYASAHGVCANNVGGGYARPHQWVKPLVPVYQPGYVLGEDDCDEWNNEPVADDCGKDDNGGVRGDNDGYPQGDVRGDNDGYDKGDVRGDNGYNDVAPDNAGYDKGGNRDNAGEAPVVADDKGKAPHDAGYVSPDKYGNKAGGRSAEKSAVSGLTNNVGGLGGLDLLGSLR
ncbi:chaplin family protein [Actinoplanes sp. NEAU-A12]|uniref:Chaplin family protein n=1 Tax=Actinoplanes sandaracinus TaxID=3045177 RepID=A0ABT6WH48_9ACTN|nr:chaplin family protein [Actinoplanes sandaracinus]MDI6099046.1 chaplin family protein [Actinoplanes sandaracinus]MDI6102941.1 chaplin family protein [Actinoplanes sandaracinus]